MKKMVEMEYDCDTSIRVLYNRLSTPEGLSEWFAKNVIQKKDKYTFVWEKSEQDAFLLSKKDNKYVRFQWDGEEYDETFFEFQIHKEDLTGSLTLIVQDFADDGEEDDVIDLWDQQISQLKQAIGI